MDGSWGLRAWRWLFIIKGVTTVAVAIVALRVLPNFPRTTNWLNTEEIALAAWRLEEDDWVNSKEQTLWLGFRLALEDVKTWALLVLLIGSMSAASVTNFVPTVVATLGYSNIMTFVLTVPPYVLGLITMFATAWHADRTGERFYHVTIPLCLAMATFIVSASTTNTGARYAAVMFMRLHNRSSVDSIYTSYLYQKSSGPRYTGAWIHNCSETALAILGALVLRTMLVRLNKKLDRSESVGGAVGAAPREAVGHGFRFLV
ncbi:hypothetical protein E4U58_004324 [Claviceps cyperi]|nr:hypothetical protein E4U58_004324 [Claviceps cyperi]